MINFLRKQSLFFGQVELRHQLVVALTKCIYTRYLLQEVGSLRKHVQEILCIYKNGYTLSNAIIILL